MSMTTLSNVVQSFTEHGWAEQEADERLADEIFARFW